MKLYSSILFVMAAAGAVAAASSCSSDSASAGGHRLVILHTNDTHSHIDPLPDNDMGGVARRKVLIDSVRAAEPNVLLVDAGDIVQGTLYFHLYKGEVEQRMLNELGYDVQILGNHEFDNGMSALAVMDSMASPALIATNYDLSGSSIGRYYQPYIVKEYDGRKVGVFSVNLNPAGMVAEGNYDGVKYLDWRSVTDATVKHLREQEGADAVIAVTHIGYESSGESEGLFGDEDLARQTSGIDVRIGGHSHTKLPENLRLVNAAGDSVLVVQTGKYGQYLGEVTLDLDRLTATSRLIPVDSRLDARRDPELMSVIEPYRAGVDSLYSHEVARVSARAGALNSKSVRLMNFAADFVADRGRRLAGGVQFAITNKGGLRTTWKPGALTEGAAIDMMPFANKVVVIDLKGADLMDALKVMAARGGDAVSRELDVTFDLLSGALIDARLDGRAIDPDATYRLATIDYLAKGGDYMTPFTRGTQVAESRRVAYDDLIEYLKANPVVNPDATERMHPED